MLLFKDIAQGNLSRSDVEEMLGIGKTRFFALLKTYRQDPDAFSIGYLRSTQGRLSSETENQIQQELLRDKALIDDEELPIHDYNYAAWPIGSRSRVSRCATTTVIKRERR